MRWICPSPDHHGTDYDDDEIEELEAEVIQEEQEETKPKVIKLMHFLGTKYVKEEKIFAYTWKTQHDFNFVSIINLFCNTFAPVRPISDRPEQTDQLVDKEPLVGHEVVAEVIGVARGHQVQNGFATVVLETYF